LPNPSFFDCQSFVPDDFQIITWRLSCACDGDIESFRSNAKRRLQNFNGIPAHTFYLHLKECEYRFNNRHKNLYRELLSLLEIHPL